MKRMTFAIWKSEQEDGDIQNKLKTIFRPAGENYGHDPC